MPADRLESLLVGVGVSAVAAGGLAVAVWAQSWWVALAVAALAGWAAWTIAVRVRRTVAARQSQLLDQLASIVAPHERALDWASSPSSPRRPASDRETLERIALIALEFEAIKRVVDALDTPVLAADDAGRVRLANRAMLGVLESDSGSVVGSRIDDLFTQSEVIELQRSAREGAPAEGRVKLIRKQRSFIYDATARQVVLADRPGVVLTLRDVTDLANAVQLKSDFVGNASHELRTPVSAIRAAVDTLLGPARGDEQMRDRLAGMIRENVLRLEDLIADLLDLSRLESPEFRARYEDVDIEDLCTQIAQAVEQTRVDRSLDLDIQIDESARRFRTDRSALLLVLRNLVDNALKFSHEEGVVGIEGSLDQGDLVIHVIDEGIGIPLAQQQRIFERFYQIDQARSGSQLKRGTGLGLAIVKHAIRQLGGSIDVHSVWQEGTTMTIRVPDSSGRDVGVESKSAPPDPP